MECCAEGVLTREQAVLMYRAVTVAADSCRVIESLAFAVRYIVEVQAKPNEVRLAMLQG